MASRIRRVEVAGPERHRAATPDHRPAALELLSGEVDPVARQQTEGPLDALPALKRGQLRLLAPGEVEQTAVGAGGSAW